MFKSAFTRVASASVVAVGLLGSSLLLAPAANASTSPTPSAKVAHTHGFYAVGKHHDTLYIDKVGKATKKFEGTLFYAHYTVTLKDGKKVLFKKVETFNQMMASAIRTETTEFTHGYSSDKALAAALRAYGKVSDKESGAYLIRVVNNEKIQARKAALQSDVRNTVDNVQTWLVDAKNQNATTYTGSTVQSTGDVVTVKLDGQGNYVVTGTDAKDHYVYSYDSATGVFSGKTVK